jgi:hypothetical protein
MRAVSALVPTAHRPAFTIRFIRNLAPRRPSPQLEGISKHRREFVVFATAHDADNLSTHAENVQETLEQVATPRRGCSITVMLCDSAGEVSSRPAMMIFVMGRCELHAFIGAF